MNITKKHILVGVSALALLLAAGLAWTRYEAGHDHDHKPKAEADHDHGSGADHEHGSGADHEHGSGADHEHGSGEAGHDDHEGEGAGAIHMDEATIARSKIIVTEAGPAAIGQEIRVMGTMVADADRLVHVTLRVSGIVTEVHKRLGEAVVPGDVLLVLDSPDLADAKAGYLSAERQEALAASNLLREEALWRRQVSAEQDYLTARAAAETARITLAAARQRLTVLGLSTADIAALKQQPTPHLGRLEVRSPIAGRVTGREAVRGELLAAEREVYTVADLSSLWVDLPVYGADLPLVRDGQKVRLTGQGGRVAEGKVIATGATLDPQTGAARVVAALDNRDGLWRPGDFGSGTIQTAGATVDVAVPADAIQTLNGESIVFVRTAEGFEARGVEIGRRNSRHVEISIGLFAGEQVASGNSFLLKAEASRGAASHVHAH